MWEIRKFDDFLEEQLQDEEFRKEYDDIQPEMDVIKAIVDARISQNLTQKELAQRIGINSYEEYRNIKAEIELLEILLEAEDDVKNGRVAPIGETFDDLKKSVLALGDIHM